MRNRVNSSWLQTAIGVGASALPAIMSIPLAAFLFLFAVWDEPRIGILWRRPLGTWGPWILIFGGPLLGIIWLYYVHINQSESSAFTPARQDRWTWAALTDPEIDTLYNQLRGAGQYSIYIACNRPECSGLADSFDQLFKRLGWPSLIGDGGFLATGITGILANPGDDEASKLLKHAIETTTSMRVDLGPARQNGTVSPTMLVLGTKPSVLPKASIGTDDLIWDDHLGHTYSSEDGTIVTKAIQISATNKSGKEIALQDAYIVSGETGEKVQLLVGADGRWITPSEANLISPGAIVTLRAEFNPPKGLPARQFVNDWKTIYLTAIYDGRIDRKTIDEKMVTSLFSSFRPSPIGPRVTSKSRN